MKKLLILLSTTILLTFSAKAQKFFFIGENSYPCTETITLQPNYDDSSNLRVTLAKDGESGLIIVSTKTMSETFISGKLIIYLDDGTVISCPEKGNKEQVDYISSTVYNLADEEIGKMKNSNINTIKYTLENDDSWRNTLSGGTFSSSNTGNTRIDFPALITEFYGE